MWWQLVFRLLLSLPSPLSLIVSRAAVALRLALLVVVYTLYLFSLPGYRTLSGTVKNIDTKRQRQGKTGRKESSLKDNSHHEGLGQPTRTYKYSSTTYLGVCDGYLASSSSVVRYWNTALLVVWIGSRRTTQSGRSGLGYMASSKSFMARLCLSSPDEPRIEKSKKLKKDNKFKYYRNLWKLSVVLYYVSLYK